MCYEDGCIEVGLKLVDRCLDIPSDSLTRDNRDTVIRVDYSPLENNCRFLFYLQVLFPIGMRRLPIKTKFKEKNLLNKHRIITAHQRDL